MEQSVRSDSTPVSAGHDTTGRHEPDHARDAAVATMLTGEVETGSAVATAIRLHEEAYGQRLYAEAGHLADAGARAEQERDAFRLLLHTPLASDADRLAYAQAVIGRAAGVCGSECQGSGRSAWMPTAYRNLAFREYAPEADGSPSGGPTLPPTPAGRRTAGASPVLTAMVEAWQALAREINDGAVTDEEAEVLGGRHTEMQIAICRFPATTTADLLAKVPVFQDEMQDAVAGLADGCDPADTLSGAAWLGLFRDFERLSKGTPERPEPAGDDISKPGFILFEDTAGTTRRRPVADWIAYMAMRLHHVARSEEARGLNAACASEPDQEANALYDRFRLDLRIDALHDLAFRSREVFEASREYAIGARRRYQGNNADLLALGRKFDAAHMAWREAVEANREPTSRYTAYLMAAKERGGPNRADCRAAEALPGVSDASHAEEGTFEAVGEISLTALKLPARTLADLAVQARAVIPHVWAQGTYGKDGAPDADEENIDKEVVRSLIESCCAAAGVDWCGAPVGDASAAEPADADFSERRDPLGDLLAGVDLQALPIWTLCALHDHVEALNNICYGLAAQPRSLNDDRTLNEAGVVLYRLAEHLLQEASDACLQEAKRRAFAKGNGHATCVAMVAQQIIENGDSDEILALARDLRAMVKA